MTSAVSGTLPLLDLHGEQLLRALGVLSVNTAKAQVALPLRAVDIQAQVADRVAQVTVSQTFHNPYTDHVEAVYIFPLAGGAAVSDFELQVGDRIIKGKVEERGEARRQYQQAIQEGKRAALLEKERDDVFTMQVGNLPPGEEVIVRLQYAEKLPYFETGSTELRLPLVVAPRYIPGQALDKDAVGHGIEDDTNVVPDASRISPPRLATGLDPQVGLSLQVEISGDEEAGLVDLGCSQHATQTQLKDGKVQIKLATDSERLNRDFVLRWRLAGDKVKSTLVTYTDGSECYGMLSVVPPHRKGFLGNARDVVFVVDRSGSMGGVKMTSAARACSHLLHTLEPRDRYALLAFDDRCEWMEPARKTHAADYFVAADEAGVERADKWLRNIDARGGTEIDGAMQQSLSTIKMRSKEEVRMPIIVLLTDGQVGDESRILKRIQKELGDARVFTVGIDTAVNEGFLQHLANAGGGTAAFVTPGENLEDALQNVGREIGEPLVVDVEIFNVDADLDDDSIAPSEIPDLFVGRATTAFFKMKHPSKVKVIGRYQDGKKFSQEVKARPLALPAIAQLWARTRVADLEDRFRLEPQQQAALRKQIVDLAVRHNLLTRFTAFVVVDHSEIVNADGTQRTVVQPVEMPAQWEMQMPGQAPAAPAASAPMMRGMPLKSRGMPAPSPLSAFGASPQMPTPAAEDLLLEAADPFASAPSWGAPPPAADYGAPPPPPRGLSVDLSPSEKRSAGGLLHQLGGLLGKSRKSPLDNTMGTDVGDIHTAPSLERKAPQSQKPTLGKSAPRSAGTGGQVAPRDGGGSDTPSNPKETARALRQALEDLEKALAEARSIVDSGRVPPALDLEKARKALLEALANAPQGAKSPLLARFLRVAAVELVSALQTLGITADALKPLFERHLEAFEVAKSELSSSGGDKFWESSI